MSARSQRRLHSCGPTIVKCLSWHSEQMECSRVTTSMRIELNCRECGSNRFTLDRDADDDAHVECEDCGHKIGTMRDLKRQVAQEVLKRASIARHADLVSGAVRREP
jgi:DNA-directed RNA polymerase subunit RPC12/RpoP